MTNITNLSKDKIKKHAHGKDINIVNNVTVINGVNRPLDSDDIIELQQSKLINISNQATYELNPSEKIATFTFTIKNINLKQAIKNRERNNNFPDEVSPELVIAREISWVASTINNGQHLRRNIGYVSHDDYNIEIKFNKSNTVINIVFIGE